MGTGKTSVGKRVAQSLDFEFVDTDEEIEKKTGQSIAQIFAESGEDEFRRIETEVLKACSQLNQRQVISTGGGIVVREENHQVLKTGGQVIWLRASPKTVYDRVKRNHNRPLLETDDPLKTIKSLLATREPAYRKCADLKVNTDELSLEETIYGVTETAIVWKAEGIL